MAGAGGLPETTAQRRRQGWARPGVGSRPPHLPSTSFLFLWGYRKERGCRGEGGQQPRTPEALEQRLFPSTADEASSGCRVGGPHPQPEHQHDAPLSPSGRGPSGEAEGGHSAGWTRHHVAALAGGSISAGTLRTPQRTSLELTQLCSQEQPQVESAGEREGSAEGGAPSLGLSTFPPWLGQRPPAAPHQVLPTFPPALTPACEGCALPHTPMCRWGSESTGDLPKVTQPQTHAAPQLPQTLGLRGTSFSGSNSQGGSGQVSLTARQRGPGPTGAEDTALSPSQTFAVGSGIPRTAPDPPHRGPGGPNGRLQAERRQAHRAPRAPAHPVSVPGGLRYLHRPSSRPCARRRGPSGRSELSTSEPAAERPTPGREGAAASRQLREADGKGRAFVPRRPPPGPGWELAEFREG